MSDIISIQDLLNFDDEEIYKVKVKFNIWNGSVNPIDEYLENPEIVNNQWLFWRGERRNFNEGEIAVCLVKISYDTWLLTTIKRVTKELNVREGINYEGEELKEYRKYFGRIVIKYHKNAQTMCRNYDKIADDLIVNQILPTSYDGEDFPGYDNIRLSFAQLKNIVDHHKRDWWGALENQKAVYLITDKHSGKLYVGSATSNNGMLLARWSSYINNGHGGNAILKKLVNEKGIEYVKQYFMYTVLENFNSNVDDSKVLARESWWKDVLCSRKFGYNDN